MALSTHTDVFPIIADLANLFPVSDMEQAALAQLPMQILEVGAGVDIVREGGRPSRCCALLEGFACTYRIGADGRRRITAFHLPGDMPDLRSLHLGVLGDSLGTLTRSRVGFIDHDDLRDVADNHPHIAQAMWREILRDGAIAREWVFNAGRPDAAGRIAHLICELAMRSRAAGVSANDSCEMAVGAREIADALGLSPVHVNRTLRELQGLGWIKLGTASLLVLEWDALKQASEFDATYLQLGRRVIG